MEYIGNRNFTAIQGNAAAVLAVLEAEEQTYMQKFLLFIIIVILSLPACQDGDLLLECADFSVKELAGSADDIKVFNAIVDDYFADSDFIHVVQESGNEVIVNSIYLTLEAANVPIDTQLVLNYEFANDNFGLIGTRIEKPARLISSDEINCLQTFERYYEKYPISDGYLMFNNIAFNAAGDRAMVDFGHFRASLGANGQLVLLKKEGNKWVITQKILTWIS